MSLKLGPYLTERVLGRGGMGTVYAALDENTDEKVAVKVLASGFANDDHFRHRFEAEIEALIKLKHPNIVEIKAYGEEGEHLYYAMEMVDGSSLFDELKSGRRFNWRETCGIGVDVCLALRHAHDRGVIHRDLKPGNLLMEKSGHVKLTDFGIAKLYGGRELTAAGSVIGTLDYMAPEQVRGEPVTTRSDLYSLGSVLFALMARRPPFASKSHPELMKCIETEPAPLVSRYAVDVPDELEEVIERLLAKEQEARIGSAIGVSKRLTSILREGKAPSEEEDAADDDFDVKDPNLTVMGGASVADAAAQDKRAGTEATEVPLTVMHTQAKAKSQPSGAEEQKSEKFITVDEQRRREAEGSFYPELPEPSIWRKIAVPGLLLVLVITLGVLGVLFAPPLSTPDDEPAEANGGAPIEQEPTTAATIQQIATLFDDGKIDEAAKLVDEFPKSEPAAIVVGFLSETRSLRELLQRTIDYARDNPTQERESFLSYLAVHEALAIDSPAARVCLYAAHTELANAEAKLAEARKKTEEQRQQLRAKIDGLVARWLANDPGVQEDCEKLLSEYKDQPWAEELLNRVSDLLEVLRPKDAGE